LVEPVPTPTPPVQPDAKKLWTLSRFLLGLAAVWLVVLVIFRNVAGPGIPSGSDSLAHLFKIWYIGQHALQLHAIPSWLPAWYEGTDLLKYYQPLFYLFSTPFYLITKNVFTTYKIVTLLWAMLVALAMYGVVYRRLGLFPAIVAAILYALAPPVIRAYLSVGLLPQAFSYIFLPLAFHFTLRLADEQEHRAKTVALLACAWALFILAHPMSAAYAMMGVGIFLAVYQATRREERHPLVITRYILSIALGVGVAALWFVPAYFGLSKPATSGESVFATSVPWRELAGLVTGSIAATGRFIPIPFAALAVVGTFWRRSALAWGLAAMGTFTMIFALGVQTPIYGWLPFSSSIFPEYGLFGACFAFAFLAGRLFERTTRNRTREIWTVAITLLVLFIVLFESQPAFNLIINRPEPTLVTKLLEQSKSLKANGRISMLGHSTAPLSFYPTVITGRNITEGFFYTGTNHYKEIANLNDVALHHLDPAYVHRKLDQWNTRYILANTTDLSQDAAVIPPEFKLAGASDFWRLFYKDEAGSNFQVMTHDTIAIGKNPAAVSLRYPWVVEGGQYIDDYDWRYLSRFKRIILVGFGFHDRKTAADLITKLAENNRTVIIDLQDVAAEFGTESVSFMNVLPIPVTTATSVTLKPDHKLPGLEDRQLRLTNLTADGEPWKAVVYSGLDSSAYNLTVDGKTYSALGTKRVGSKGVVYFAGMNLFFHNLQSNDKNGAKLTDWLAGPRENNLYLPNFPVTAQSWGDKTITFTYHSTCSEPVIASTTWTDNWRATIDGQPLRAYDYENLPLFFLPAGRHTIQLTYGTTASEVFATIISVISMAIVLYILIRSVRNKNGGGNPGL
jgi:uncharacterized membrane protein